MMVMMYGQVDVMNGEIEMLVVVVNAKVTAGLIYAETRYDPLCMHNFTR